jgi:hypothetical protein
MKMHITAHAGLPRVERNSINSTILIHPKRRYAYGGEHGTFNAIFSNKHNSMIALNGKTMGETE